MPIAGRRKGRETKKEKTKKKQYTHRINNNLPGESIAREKGRVLLFVNRGEITPLLQKAIQEKKKQRKGHNTQKIIKI